MNRTILTPLLLTPLLLAACVPAIPRCDHYRTECQPGDTRCACERPEADDKRTAYTRPEPPKVEPPKPEPPRDMEPDREKDPDGWRDWRDRTPRGGAF